MGEPSDRDREMAREHHGADGNDLMYAFATARAEGHAEGYAAGFKDGVAAERLRRRIGDPREPEPAHGPEEVGAVCAVCNGRGSRLPDHNDLTERDRECRACSGTGRAKKGRSEVMERRW